MGNSLIRGVCVLLVVLSALVWAEERSPQVTVVVGNRRSAEGGAVDAAASPLQAPFGVDFDSRGDMVIVELEGGRVHRLGAGGELRTIAGDGSKSYTGDGGPAKHATFNGMHNVAISKTDDVYIADSWNHCIRKISAATGEITTFAGTGEAGFSGDGGPAAEATFDFVMCITFDPACAQLYVADLRNRRIREIDMQTHIVRTVAGNGEQGVPQDGAVSAESPLVDPRAVAADAEGNVYVLERGGHALRVVAPDGRIRTVAGTGKRGFHDGPADAAQFDSPKHVCVDDRGCVYIADDRNAAIRKYDPRSQTVSTVLGRGDEEHAIRLKNPHGVAFERGRLYVVDMGHNRILRLE